MECCIISNDDQMFKISYNVVVQVILNALDSSRLVSSGLKIARFASSFTFFWTRYHRTLRSVGFLDRATVRQSWMVSFEILPDFAYRHKVQFYVSYVLLSLLFIGHRSFAYAPKASELRLCVGH